MKHTNETNQTPPDIFTVLLVGGMLAWVFYGIMCFISAWGRWSEEGSWLEYLPLILLVLAFVAVWIAVICEGVKNHRKQQRKKK